jgi:cell division septation protein DedD
MTKHTMVTIRLHRIGVILIVVGVVLFAILLFAGGFIAGMQRGKRVALTKPAIPKLQLPPAPVPLPAARADGGQQRAEGSAPPPSAQEGEAFTIRTGAFASEDDAKALVKRLAARKLDATVEPRSTSEGTNFFVVLAGRYTDRKEAATVAEALAKDENLDTAVVPAH